MAQMKEFVQDFPIEENPALRMARFQLVGASLAIRFADVLCPEVVETYPAEEDKKVFRITSDPHGNYLFHEEDEGYEEPDRILYRDSITRMIKDRSNVLDAHYSYHIGPDPRRKDLGRNLELILPPDHKARYHAVSSFGSISIEGGSANAVKFGCRMGDIAIKRMSIECPPQIRSYSGNVACQKVETDGNFTAETSTGRIFIDDSRAFKWILRAREEKSIIVDDSNKGRVEKSYPYNLI